MAGVQVASLSSNWKRLQQTLKPTPKPDGPSPGVKRKRTNQADADFKKYHSTSNGAKRARTELTKPSHAQRKYKMGQTPSKAAATSANAEQVASRPSSDTADRRSTSSSTDSLVNQGLHPTHKPGKFLALDCEMVGTGPLDDNVLARVSIVNFHCEQVYDSFVQPVPGVEVTDYRTFVSGIRPHHLKPDYARPFSQVQKEVAALLDGKILVGHALKNDMDVLLLSHPKRDIRDTARHPAFRKMSMGRAPALRKLAKEYLGMDIQGGEHSSVEDARATMMLFKLEKDAFEKDIKQKYGAAIRREEKAKLQEEYKKAKKEELKQMKENGEGSDSEEDEDEDEEDEEQLDDEGNVIAPAIKKSKKSKKNKKRKKRTKRA